MLRLFGVIIYPDQSFSKTVKVTRRIEWWLEIQNKEDGTVTRKLRIRCKWAKYSMAVLARLVSRQARFRTRLDFLWVLPVVRTHAHCTLSRPALDWSFRRLYSGNSQFDKNIEDNDWHTKRLGL